MSDTVSSMGPRRSGADLRSRAMADLSGLAARHPQVFRPALGPRLLRAAVVVLAVALLIFGFWRLEFSFARLTSGLGQLGTFLSLMWPPVPETQTRALIYGQALLETLGIAFLGTLLAAIIAFPLSLLAAKNVVASRVLHFFARRSLDTIRGVDTLIWALIWVGIVGLGPFAGVLAVMTSDIGSFGKLFSEAIEAADKKPVEGVTAAGGGKLHAVRFGLLPQVFPVMASQVLYFFESNTRSATIIGIVGAGGIGLYLAEQIRVLEWDDAAFIVLMILVTVAVIDWISSRLRLAVIGRSSIAAT